MKRRFILGATILLACMALVAMGQKKPVPPEIDPNLSPELLNKGIAQIRRINYVQYTDWISTNSTTWEPIPGMVRYIRIAGTRYEEVVVLFQAWWEVYDYANVRLMVDGVVQQFSVWHTIRGPFVGYDYSANGYQWITAPLKPKVEHTVWLEWHSYEGGTIRCMDPKMIVLYK